MGGILYSTLYLFLCKIAALPLGFGSGVSLYSEPAFAPFGCKSQISLVLTLLYLLPWRAADRPGGGGACSGWFLRLSLVIRHLILFLETVRA